MKLEMCLLMWKLSQNEEYIGTFKKHVETLHYIASWYNDRKSRKMLENAESVRKWLKMQENIRKWLKMLENAGKC